MTRRLSVYLDNLTSEQFRIVRKDLEKRLSLKMSASKVVQYMTVTECARIGKERRELEDVVAKYAPGGKFASGAKGEAATGIHVFDPNMHDRDKDHGDTDEEEAA